jgi:hypothetical protein
MSMQCDECGLYYSLQDQLENHGCSHPYGKVSGKIEGMETQKGIKHDQEKARMDLLSSDWLEGVAQVLSFGAKKYQSHNWRKGIERSRLLASSLRHIFAYLKGEDYDPETGLLHLYHASCGLMFASELHFTRPDTDDRYKNEALTYDTGKSPPMYTIGEGRYHIQMPAGCELQKNEDGSVTVVKKS